MNTYEVLRATKQLLGAPDRWSQGANARKRNGEPTTWSSPDVYSCDLASAICRVALENKLEGSEPVLVKAAKAVRKAAYDYGYNAIIKANDLGDFATIHKILDMAIADERRRLRDFS